MFTFPHYPEFVEGEFDQCKRVESSIGTFNPAEGLGQHVGSHDRAPSPSPHELSSVRLDFCGFPVTSRTDAEYRIVNDSHAGTTWETQGSEITRSRDFRP